MTSSTLNAAPPEELLVDLHVKYIQSLDEKRDHLYYHTTQHLRMNGIYWGLTALSLMRRKDALPRQEMLDWVMSCYDPVIGGFAPHPDHEPHLHPTLSAIQILATHDALHLLDTDKLVQYVLSLQSPSGAFAGDQWGEQASRFTYCAVSCLSLLDRLDDLDTDRTVSWIEACTNFDGGFGMCPGAESHAAYVWTCLGTLAILGRLDLVDKDTLCWWLCERQLPCGGLNGRPEKLEDVCYSWWALASLAIMGREHWIDAQKLKSFILSAQDPDEGGIADRPEDLADVWHTVFGIAGLSLLSYPGLEPVDPIYCMPAEATKRLVGMRRGDGK
ncbi:protein geranylgeranyltransferase type II [Microbotryum lychnidis-dioicae p1A1 Lamole]|uniref:Geranylgeranyl transferase type-2 subunit beta n=1 Tax=Microbotryum lychnidis-dioicae (strain p1A1 Lamole / MvSl-1064) TaxID=683840 RepID=U5H006_USTV1|nr:protein geranylgeranyltransferase type II [Microbotryum lychnidis-dioicae p1A1 Lamole]|eukprot:KDE09028.1 protein geranylgeranyltransferase type II [Microbotryum lychnidis-dioicae p1A1 Lamole]